MTKLEALIEEARRLSTNDRRRLLAEVERSLKGGKGPGTASTSYGPLLSLAGSAPSDFSDVSTEKYRHVADAIAPEPGDE